MFEMFVVFIMLNENCFYIECFCFIFFESEVKCFKKIVFQFYNLNGFVNILFFDIFEVMDFNFYRDFGVYFNYVIVLFVIC